ncbi:MAG TPA: hypothetical protein VK712_01295 [Verrucomicrobiae bacterium]|jgi:hypothetical protein|nr:hypothetical protein [Verrucomicrobiae bacterium]
MKSQRSNNLSEELKLAGASDTEAHELVAVASSLKHLKDSRSSAAKSMRHGQLQSKLRAFIPIGLTSLGGLALGMAVVIFSQTVLPGSLLYPVQKLSDNVAMSANPDYRGTVMMKRAQEVKQLIAAHASPNLVLATLADYRREAAAYKSAPANYAVFEYCKTNLQQAAATAPSSERQAINKTVSSLHDA